MNSTKKLVKAINNRFAKKQNELTRIPAEMGNGYGGLEVEGMDSFIYVMINGKPVPIFNNRVANHRGTKVWVGHSAEEPDLFQVLSTRSETPAGSQNGYVGYAPAKRYEWHAVRGGQDPLAVHLRAMTPLKLSVSDTVPNPPTELLVNLYRGFVYNGERYYQINRQDIDLSSHLPTLVGKAAFVLITINSSGAVIQTKGDEVDIDSLAITDIPAIPANTIFVCGAVRVFYGQEKIKEGRTNTDFVDVRFTSTFGFSGSGAFVTDWENIQNLPSWMGNALEPATFVTGREMSSYFIDGSLAVLTDVTTAFVVQRYMKLHSVLIHCKDKGSASTTIVDMNLNGTTVFTDQGKRPMLDWDATDDFAISDTPDVIELAPGDVLTFDIDAIGTDASGLTITPYERIIEMVTVEDDIANVQVEMT